MTSVNLSKYDNSWFYIGAGKDESDYLVFRKCFFL